MRCSPLILALSGLAGAAPLAAQSFWLVPQDRHGLLVEVLHPSFGGDVVEFPSAAVYLTVRLRVAEDLALQVELPAALANLSPVLADLTETGVGNPYVGVVFRRPGAGFWGEVGARLPIATDNASGLVGAFADLDRFVAWPTDVLPVSALGGYRWSAVWGGFVAIRGGPGFWVDLGDAESEVVVHGSVQAGIESPRAAFTTGFTTLTALTTDGGFGERSLIQGGIVAELRLGRVRPGVTLFVPIDDDLRQAVDLVVGLRLAVVIP